MQSQEFTSKVTIRKSIDEGDGWPIYKMTVENIDCRATILLNKKDLSGIVSDIADCLADIDEENEGGDNA